MLREPDLTPLPKELDWTCENPGRGEKFPGVIAGRARKFLCHAVGQKRVSKPCITYATDGKLRCWCDQRPAERRPVVYVPVYAEAGQLVVRLGAVQGYILERQTKPGMLVSFETGKGKTSPTKVKKVESVSAVGARLIESRRKCDIDILEYLCHLWQLHALTRYCGFTPHRSIAGASTVDLSEPDYAPRFSHAEKLLAERIDAEGE